MKTETENQYHKQAEDFLSAHGITVKFVYKGDRCPKWKAGQCDHIHGDRYRVYFRRFGGITFNIDFWNSYSDSRSGIEPNAYDILACIEKRDPENFPEFCSEYGLDEDSISTMETWKACTKQWTQVSKFFNEKEISELQEIQ